MPKTITVTDVKYASANIQRVVREDKTILYQAGATFNCVDAAGKVIYSKSASRDITDPAAITYLNNFFATALSDFKTSEEI